MSNIFPPIVKNNLFFNLFFMISCHLDVISSTSQKTMVIEIEYQKWRYWAISPENISISAPDRLRFIWHLPIAHMVEYRSIHLSQYIYVKSIGQWVFLCLFTWVRSRNCGCLVTWFCYQLIAKPGNMTAAVSWPGPLSQCSTFNSSPIANAMKNSSGLWDLKIW